MIYSSGTRLNRVTVISALILKSTPRRGVPTIGWFDYKQNRAWAENLSIVMQIGLTMVGCIGFCFFIGYQLDRWIGLRGVFVTIFTILGILGGANVVYRQILKVTQEDQKEDSKNGSD